MMDDISGTSLGNGDGALMMVCSSGSSLWTTVGLGSIGRFAAYMAICYDSLDGIPKITNKPVLFFDTFGNIVRGPNVTRTPQAFGPREWQ